MLPLPVRAGLYEALTAEKVRWMPETPPPEPEPATMEERLKTPDAKAKFLDPRWEPSLMIRTLFVYTQRDEKTIKTADGGAIKVDTDDQPKTIYGQREGFVLENVELGMYGRFNDSGVYYQAKMELIPREKDGTVAESEFLKDAYFGWNKYRVFDVRVGRMKIPFSRASLTSTADQTFIGAPVLDAMVVKRQTGGMLSFSDPWRTVKLSGGVFNSAKQALESLRNMNQLLYVGRLEVPVHNILKATNSHFMDFEFEIAADAAWVKEYFDPTTEHRWIGLDAKLHLWLFTLEGEYLQKDAFIAGAGGAKTAFQGKGWNADLTFHAWPGVINLNARIEQMDGNSSENSDPVANPVDQKKRWISGGLSLLAAKQVRLDFNYIHRMELENVAPKNDVFMGMFQFNY